MEVAEQKAAPREKPLKDAPHQAPAQLERMRSGTYLGMAFSNIIAFFIILDTAAVLHAHGITDIQTGAQAAEALRPLAGELAFLLFSIGIIGTGLIAIPVLAGSSAYALAEALKLPIGLERKLHRAKGFYAILAVATLIGVALNFTGINPIKALFWSAVINGVAAVPIMIVMMLMTTNKNITGELRLPTLQKVIGWIATGVMFIVAASMIATTYRLKWLQLLDEFDNSRRGIARDCPAARDGTRAGFPSSPIRESSDASQRRATDPPARSDRRAAAASAS